MVYNQITGKGQLSMTHTIQSIQNSQYRSGRFPRRFSEATYESDPLHRQMSSAEAINDYGEIEHEPADDELSNEPDELQSSLSSMTFMLNGGDELLIHHQNAAVLSADELAALAQQMEQARSSLSRLMIHSNFGLQVLAGEFIRSIDKGIDLSELIRKNNGDTVQNDTFAQDTAKQLLGKLQDHFQSILEAKDNRHSDLTFLECRKSLDELHFLPNFLQQIVKVLTCRIKDRALNDEALQLLKSASIEQQRMIAARRAMISGNLRLVTFIARQYHNSSVPFSDLIQDGTIGLIKAVDRYDWHRAVRFSTYAIYWIKQSITRGLVRQDKMVRLPYNIAAKAAAVFETMNDYLTKNNKWPTNKELARICDLPESEIKAIVDNYQPIISLDNNINDDEDLPAVIDSIEQHHYPQPLNILANSALKTCLRKAVETLPQREADIINCRFGLDSDCEMTLQDIADRMNLTRERVRQIQNSALLKLKNKFSSDLVDFLEVS